MQIKLLCKKSLNLVLCSLSHYFPNPKLICLATLQGISVPLPQELFLKKGVMLMEGLVILFLSTEAQFQCCGSYGLVSLGIGLVFFLIFSLSFVWVLSLSFLNFFTLSSSPFNLAHAEIIDALYLPFS